MRKFKPQMLIPIVLLGIFGLGGWYVDAQRAGRRSALSGYFESRPTEVSSRVGGRIARILVHEGDPVSIGRPLMELDATPAKEDTAAKQAAAEQARQQLREVVNGPRPEDIRKQAATVAEAQANLARLRNGPLPEEIAQAEAKLREADAQYRKAVAGPRPQEIAQARAAARDALARLAQAQRGPTPEEKAQAKARLDDAAAQEDLARRDEARIEMLYREDAVSRQQIDQAQTALRQATARRQEQQEAYRRAEEGTPQEELEQAQEAYRQAKAALDLVLAGSRPEDIAAAKAVREQARQALLQLRRGSRIEDVHAAQARLQQAQATLAELRAGSRKEQIAQARAAAKAAKATAQSSLTNLMEWIVRAPQDGVVESVPVAVGDLITPQTVLLRLDNPTDIWIRVYVPEAQLARVTVGADAELRVDGIAAPISGYVESVATRGEFTPANLQSPDERGKQVFAVRLRLKRPDPRVKAGMAATVKRIGTWSP